MFNFPFQVGKKYKFVGNYGNNDFTISDRTLIKIELIDECPSYIFQDKNTHNKFIYSGSPLKEITKNIYNDDQKHFYFDEELIDIDEAKKIILNILITKKIKEKEKQIKEKEKKIKEIKEIKMSIEEIKQAKITDK